MNQTQVINNYITYHQMQESYQYHMNPYFPIMPNQLLIPQFGHYQPNPFQYTFLNPNQYFPIQEFQQNTDIFKIVESNEKKEDNNEKEHVKCPLMKILKYLQGQV